MAATSGARGSLVTVNPFPIPARCACPEPLWRAILTTELMSALDLRVVACMRCGEVDAFKDVLEAIPYDPHDASRVVGHERVPFGTAIVAWLATWPRTAGDPLLAVTTPQAMAFLSASLRCPDTEALARAEEVARADVGRPIEQRLREAGLPAPPPPDVPRQLRHFRETWEAMHLPPDVSMRERLDRGNPHRRPASWFVPLPQGAALIAEIAKLFGDADKEVRAVGVSALNLLRPREPGWAMPEPIVSAAGARIRALRAAGDEAQALYVGRVLAAHDRDVGPRLELAAGPR